MACTSWQGQCAKATTPVCICVRQQELEKAAKGSEDLEKQVQQLQKKCADVEADAAGKEVGVLCCGQASSARHGLILHQVLCACRHTRTHTNAWQALLHPQGACHCTALHPPDCCVHLQASFQEVTKKLQDLTKARAHDRRQVG